MAKSETRSGAVRRFPGPRSLFRGKVRQRKSLTLTPKGHDALASAVARTLASEADTIEVLLHQFGPLLTRDIAEGIAEKINRSVSERMPA